MKKAKRLVPLILCLCLILSGCAARKTDEKDSSKLQIVCTNFPAYDFVREIAGDRAQIKLLIKPGAEVHSYEPAPKDIIAIRESDLFVCNGGESEAWAESLVGDDVNVLRMMDCVETVAESGEGIYAAEDEHDNEHDDGEEELDEHVWTTPGNAAKICYALCDKLAEADPDNANEYMLNYEVYNAKLMELDIDIRTTILNGVRDTLVFADRFPMRYFTREYGLKYYAAIPAVRPRPSHRQKP